MLRVYITDDMIGMGVRIFIVREATDRAQITGPVNERSILRIGHDETGGRLHRWEDVSAEAATVEPTLRLGEDEARALLDGLVRHFQGAEDTRALRRDYDHERKRVDMLVGSLTQIAGTLAEPS